MKAITMKLIVRGAALSLALLGGVATVASADDGSDAMETQRFEGAAQTLSQAVTAAEKEIGGKAMSAEFEADKSGKDMYMVEILKGDGSTIDAMVSAADGSVRAMAKSDDTDHENGDDDDGDQDEDNG